MRFVACGLLLGCVLAWPGSGDCSPLQPAAAPTAAVQAPSVVSPKTSGPTVILISIDGYRADYLQRGLSPNLAGLARAGTRAKWMTPSFPTLTFPNHYTLVTGLYPDHHGIVDNNMEDAAIPGVHFSMANRKAIGDQRWWDEATPLWVSVQQQGARAAAEFWPGSSTPIHGMRPDYWSHFDPNTSADARVDQVLHWLDLPPAQRPRFIALYFNQVDHQGHEYGPDSKQVDDALHNVDDALGRLVEGLKARDLFSRVDLVIVSDHGMAPVSPLHIIYLGKIVNIKLLHPITLDAMAGLHPKESNPATEHAIAVLLAPHPHMRCMRKQDIPERLHYGGNARVPPYICIADTGWLITTRRAQSVYAHPVRGEHGYDNTDPLMRALFVAEGPSFRAGYIAPPFPNVDVYPLLAHLLHVRPEKNDGDYAAVQAMLKPEAR